MRGPEDEIGSGGATFPENFSSRLLSSNTWTKSWPCSVLTQATSKRILVPGGEVTLHVQFMFAV